MAEFLAERPAESDPLWAASGAASAADYGRWAGHLCGCACLQMVLGALGRPVPSIHDIRRAVQAEGGYVETELGEIRGLIYAGAVAWLTRQGIPARILLDQSARNVAALDGLFIASVHPGIRRADQPAAEQGGHLVLIFGTDASGALRLHNPSGDTPATQQDARIVPDRFAGFFAGRGIHIDTNRIAPG